MGGRQVAMILGTVAVAVFAIATFFGTGTVRDGSTACGSALRPKTFRPSGSGAVQVVGGQVVDFDSLVAGSKTIECHSPITQRREVAGAVAGVGIAVLLAAGLLVSRDRTRVAHHV